MLTGDKGETALEIGLSCGLYDKESRIFKLGDGFEDIIEEELTNILNEIKGFEPKCFFAISGNFLPLIFD